MRKIPGDQGRRTRRKTRERVQGAVDHGIRPRRLGIETSETREG